MLPLLRSFLWLLVPLVWACGPSVGEERPDAVPDAVPAASPAGEILSSGEPLTLEIPIDDPSALASEELRLVVEARAPAGPASYGLRIFLERPDADRDTPLDVPHYLGSIAFGQRGGEPAPEVERFVLPIADIVDRLGGAAAVGDLEVTLLAVPLHESGATGRGATIRVDAVRLVTEEP